MRRLVLAATVLLSGCAEFQHYNRARHGPCVELCERAVGGPAAALCGRDGACTCMALPPRDEFFKFDRACAPLMLAVR